MTYRLSRDADADLDEIFLYSARRFGEQQADRYLDGLQRLFSFLTENPKLGRDYGRLSPGLRRIEHASHSVYYRLDEEVIFILRILGKSQDPLLHL